MLFPFSGLFVSLVIWGTFYTVPGFIRPSDDFVRRLSGAFQATACVGQVYHVIEVTWMHVVAFGNDEGYTGDDLAVLISPFHPQATAWAFAWWYLAVILCFCVGLVPYGAYLVVHRPEDHNVVYQRVCILLARWRHTAEMAVPVQHCQETVPVPDDVAAPEGRRKRKNRASQAQRRRQGRRKQKERERQESQAPALV